MRNLVVFAVIGLLAGAAARMLFPGRQPMRILSTLALGAIGGLIGGMISWSGWPEVDNQFQAGNLIVSILGAFAAILAWQILSYARGIGGYRNPTQ
jgi:uncharacterized membrane protein YeaQ/YmgE (transglycosylase-associated protein family)